MTLVARLLNHFRMGTTAERQTASGDVFTARLHQMHMRNAVACRKTPFKNSRSHRAV